METYGLEEFFDKINYNWKNDKEKIEEICRLTKTRYKENPPESSLGFGSEQPFFLKAVVDYMKSVDVMEIGTGRGTGSYAMSLSESVEKVTTFDIIPFDAKQQTAIGYEKAYASVADLYRLIPYAEKAKIDFLQRSDTIPDHTSFGWDLAFIDGDHTDEENIREDFKLCEHILDNGGVVIWDDYGQSEFTVKKVVDSIPEVNTILVEFRGHLFSDKDPEKNIGEIIMTKNKFFK